METCHTCSEEVRFATIQSTLGTATSWVHRVEPRGHRVMLGVPVPNIRQIIDDMQAAKRGDVEPEEEVDEYAEPEEPGLPDRVFVKVDTVEEALNQTGRRAIKIIKRLGWKWSCFYSAHSVMLQATDGIHGLQMIWRGRAKLAHYSSWIWSDQMNEHVGTAEVIKFLQQREASQ